MHTHVIKLKGYFERIEHLGFQLTEDLAINFILNSLTSVYKQFTMNYYMNGL